MTKTQRTARVLASQCFLHTVLTHCNMSPSEFERQRSGHKRTNKSTLRHIFKPLRGDSYLKTNSPLIKFGEKLLPGSSQILDHPLWEILGNPDANLHCVRQMMMKLPLDVNKNLFSYNPNIRGMERRILKGPNEIHRVALRCDLDALAYVLMIIRETEILDMPEPYVSAKWSAIYIIRVLSLDRAIVPILDDLKCFTFTEFVLKNPCIKFHSHILQDIIGDRLEQPIKSIINTNLESDLCKKIISWSQGMGLLSRAARPQQINKYLYLVWYCGIKDIHYALEANHHNSNLVKSNELPPPLDHLNRKFHARNLMHPSPGKYHYGYENHLKRIPAGEPTGISNLSMRPST